MKPLADSLPTAPLPAAALNAELTLSFVLPVSFQLMVGPGRWGPCLHQARVDVDACWQVEIRGFNGSLVEARRIVFDQAKRFLLTIAGGRDKMPMESFTAVLRRAGGERYEHHAIVTGAAVSITRAIERPELVA